jgi:small conductance mechanosensitive channel
MDVKQYFTDFLSTALGYLINASIRIVIAIALLILTFKIVNYLASKIEKSGDEGRIDKTLARAFAYVFKLGVKAIIIICLIGFIGIDTSGFTALIVSLGAGIGLALNGALSNLAGGIIIILTRPIRVDDFIEAQGYSGTVEDIHVTNTKLRTPDNKVVYIPNGPLSSGTIVNYSVKDTRRLDFTFLISYKDDFESVKRMVTDVCASHSLVLLEPEPMVRVSSHGESGVEITARVWVKRENYWTVNYDILEMVKAAFDKRGIEIPYPQLDIHLKRTEL